MSKPTLKTLANEANVSVVTVHRVLRNKSNVAKDTRDRVVDVMRRHGLGAPTPMLVGVIVPDSSNPFFSELCFKFEQVFEELGVHALISSSEGRVERELALVDRFQHLGVKGLIYISAGRGADAILRLIAQGSIPVVAFDRRVHAGNLDFVAVNSRHGTLCAVDYLVAHRHKRIGYIKGLEGTESARERFESFREAMAQNSLTINTEWVFEGTYRFSSGRNCAERLIATPEKDRPTAILAANDLMAIGLMQRLQQEGWVLPQQLSVIGFDNIQWSEWVHPALTTIDQPVGRLVHEAARCLLHRIKQEGGTSTPRGSASTVEIEPTLIPRQSVAEPWEGREGLQLVRAG